MRVAYFGYREWSLGIFQNVRNYYNENPNNVEMSSLFSFNTSEVDFRHGNEEIYEEIECEKMSTKIMNSEKVIESIDRVNPDYLLFVGWSWMIGKEILDKYSCLCLHPSALPKYRGGSPIQHQIINGEKKSAVSILKMTENIDDGPVYTQEEFSLDGNIGDVFKGMADSGTQAIIRTLSALSCGIDSPIEQDVLNSTTFKRRKKKDSEISESSFSSWDSEKMYNFIRSLGDPYPNAYVEYPNGDRLLFKSVELKKKGEL